MIEIIAVHELEGSDDPISLFAKGHVDKSQFVHEAKRQTEISILVSNVRYAYFRCVPLKGGGSCYYLSGAGRGAFPVTLVDLI